MSRDTIATVGTAVLVALVIFVALAVLFTARPDGSIGRPRWPARYPARPEPQRRRWLVGDEEWDEICRRAGWEPGEETAS